MSDVDWTQSKTDKAVALWIAGGDVMSIAAELETTPAEVMARIAQAAADRTKVAPGASMQSSEPAASGPLDATAISTRPPAPKVEAAPAKAKPAAKVAAPKAPKPVSPKASVVKTTAQKPDTAKPARAETAAEPVRRVVPAPAALELAANDTGAEPAPTAPLVPAAYDPTANHVPVRTSKRLLAASDGGEGMPFMKATAMDCHFPLWADNEQVSIEVKRVCGCRVQTGKSWCPHHLQAVFEPPRKPQPRVA